MKYSVEFGEDYIAVKRGKKEVCYWHEQEWKDDSQVVFSIVNVAKLVYSNKNSLLDRLLQARIV